MLKSMPNLFKSLMTGNRVGYSSVDANLSNPIVEEFDGETRFTVFYITPFFDEEVEVTLLITDSGLKVLNARSEEVLVDCPWQSIAKFRKVRSEDCDRKKVDHDIFEIALSDALISNTSYRFKSMQVDLIVERLTSHAENSGKYMINNLSKAKSKSTPNF